MKFDVVIIGASTAGLYAGERLALAGKKVGVILTGGNVDLSSYFEGIHAAPP